MILVCKIKNFNGKALLDATSDMNRTKLSSAGIGDINVDDFFTNRKRYLFNFEARSSMDGNKKFFYSESCDSIKAGNGEKGGGGGSVFENLVGFRYPVKSEQKRRIFFSFGPRIDPPKMGRQYGPTGNI